MSDKLKEFVKGLAAPSPGFEKQWLEKLSNCLEKYAGEEVRKEILKNSEKLLKADQDEIIQWSRETMKKLETLIESEEARINIMTGCACQYPYTRIEHLREMYRETKDVEAVHRKLQEIYESDLREGLGLSEELIQEILKKGWGTFGKIQKYKRN